MVINGENFYLGQGCHQNGDKSSTERNLRKENKNENVCKTKIEKEEASVRNGMLFTFPGAFCITTSYVKASNTLKEKIGLKINIINVIMGANMLNIYVQLQWMKINENKHPHSRIPQNIALWFERCIHCHAQMRQTRL